MPESTSLFIPDSIIPGNIYESQMRRLRHRGVRFDVIRTYEGLARLRDEFLLGRNGNYRHFLMVVGAPGLGKSRSFERDGVAYINTAASAIGIYRWAFEHRDEPLVLDDVDDLLLQPASVSIIKALGETRENKRLCWTKQNKVLEADGIPREFETRSRLVILANEYPPAKSANMLAVYDRARLVFFLPDAREVHAYVASWFRPKVIHGFVGKHLDRIIRPSCRWYTEALEEYRLCNDWQEWLLRQWEGDDPMASVVAEAIRSHPDDVGRQLDFFRESTGKKRAWFFRVKRRLLAGAGSA